MDEGRQTTTLTVWSQKTHFSLFLLVLLHHFENHGCHLKAHEFVGVTNTKEKCHNIFDHGVV